MLERMWRKGNPLTLLKRIEFGLATVYNSVEVPQKYCYVSSYSWQKQHPKQKIDCYAS